jgi:hypothetical protein
MDGAIELNQSKSSSSTSEAAPTDFENERVNRARKVGPFAIEELFQKQKQKSVAKDTSSPSWKSCRFIKVTGNWLRGKFRELRLRRKSLWRNLRLR